MQVNFMNKTFEQLKSEFLSSGLNALQASNVAFQTLRYANGNNKVVQQESGSSVTNTLNVKDWTQDFINNSTVVIL